MLRQIKKLLYFGVPVLTLTMLQWSCKKKDVYPSEQLPVITSLSPSSAIMGTQIVIKGVNLKNVTDVKFGSVEAANFSASGNTDTSIKVTVPDSLALGPQPVQVYYANGKGYATANFTVLLVPPVPRIDSVSPINAYPGNTVTISGNNFALVTTVTFNGVIASFAHSLDTNGKMTAVVPANATGGLQFIKLINPNGSDSIAFTVNLGPVINSINPNSGKAGDSITIKGIRFTGTTSVKVNGQTAGFAFWNDSTLKFAVPAGAQNGNVTVTTPLGTAVSPSGFVVIVPIALFIYGDAMLANWQISSYTANTNDTAFNAEGGTHSLYTAYTGGYGAFRLDDFQASSTFVNLAAYTTLRVSVYGGPGTGGHTLSLSVNGNYGTTVALIISEGKYTDYFVPLSQLGSPATLSEIVLQEFSNDAGTTIYVDNVGLN
jgi:IPT/TIG domain